MNANNSFARSLTYMLQCLILAVLLYHVGIQYSSAINQQRIIESIQRRMLDRQREDALADSQRWNDIIMHIDRIDAKVNEHLKSGKLQGTTLENLRRGK